MRDLLTLLVPGSHHEGAMDVESRPMTNNSNGVIQSTMNSICAVDGLTVAETIDGLAEALAHLSISKDGQRVQNL